MPLASPRGWSRSTSRIGAAGASPRSSICWKTGVSSSLRRIHSPNATQQAGEQEGQSPAPGVEGFLGEQRREEAEHGVGEHVAQRRAHLGRGRPEATVLRLAELRGQQDGAAPLATHADTLGEPQRDQQDGRENSHLSVGGQHTDQEGRDPDQHQRPDQHPLPSDPVAEAAEEDPTERAGDVAHGVRAEGEQSARQGVAAREEQVAEHQRSRGTVDREVVPLQ